MKVRKACSKMMMMMLVLPVAAIYLDLSNFGFNFLPTCHVFTCV